MCPPCAVQSYPTSAAPTAVASCQFLSVAARGVRVYLLPGSLSGSVKVSSCGTTTGDPVVTVVSSTSASGGSFSCVG